MSVRFVRTIFILVLLIIVSILPSSTYASPLGNAPINDKFVNAQVLVGSIGNVISSNVDATKEVDWEPNHAGEAGGASIWFVWTAPSDSNMTFDTTGSDFDTLLAVYTWPNSSGPLIEVGSNDDAIPGVIVTSSVTFNALTGVTYYVAVDGFDGATGNVVLNWASTDSIVIQPPASPTPDTGLAQSTVCPSPQIASFTISPTEIKRGDTATLNWGAVTNANSAVIDNGIGGVPAPGSRQIRPDKNTTFTLTANGCGGTNTARASISVFAIGQLYQGIPEGPTNFRPRLSFNWSNRSGYDGDTYLSNIEIQIERNGSYQPFELTENFELQGNGYQNRTPFQQGRYKIRFRWWMTDRQTHQRVSTKSAWSVICFNYNDNETCQ